jgi:hypothetical protein
VGLQVGLRRAEIATLSVENLIRAAAGVYDVRARSVTF